MNNPIAELIKQWGSLYTEKPCGCCNKKSLVAIRYPDKDLGTVYLCPNCDVAG